MAPIATDFYINNYVEACSIDQCLEEKFLCTKRNPNFEPMMSDLSVPKSQANNSSVARTHKSYEMKNSTLSESYFCIDEMDDAQDFISDYASGYKNGVILVVNNLGNEDEIKCLTAGLNAQLKHLIICDSVSSENIRELNHLPNKIESENMNNAILTAYNMAINGQAILIQGVDQNFDFFSYLQ